MSDSFKVTRLAFELAKEFRKHYIKYSFKIYKITNVKKSKWWPHFIKTAEKYINEKDFNPSAFISIQFNTYGKVLPHFLAGKNAEKAYRQNFFKETTDEEKIISQIEGSKEAVKIWAAKNKKKQTEYFEDGNAFTIKRKIEYLSPYYLAFSKSFLQAFAKIPEENREEIVSPKELSTKRALAKQLMLDRKIRDLLEEDYR